jgi:hypothetical protein
MWHDMELPMSNAVYSNVVPQSSTILGRLWESIHSISHWYGCTCQTGIFATTPDLHGGGKFQLTYKILSPYMLTNALSPPTEEAQYRFVSHVSHQAAVETVKNNKSLIICRMPLGAIATYLTLGQATSIAKTHRLFVARGAPLTTIVNMLVQHQCFAHCYDNVYIFKPIATDNKRKRNWQEGLSKAKRKERQIKEKGRILKSNNNASFKSKRSAANNKAYAYKTKKPSRFPPALPKDKLLHKIVTEFCKDTHPSQFEESGCAACGRLTPLKDLIKCSQIECSLDPLIRSEVTSTERTSESDEIKDNEAPILDSDCHSMCSSCHKYLEKGVSPPMALANGLWLGKVTLELAELTFVEKLLISCIRHNRCIVKVAAG